jgi:CheY-like chemotaxis protein
LIGQSWALKAAVGALPNRNVKMRIHPLTLNFNGPHQVLESAFRQHYFQSTLRQVRIALVAAAFFYSIYGIVDAIAAPQDKCLFWMLRWGVIVPLILLMVFFTYSRQARRFLPPVLALGTGISGSVVIFMIMTVPEKWQLIYISGLVQILFYVYTLLRIRFVWAFPCLSLLLFGYWAGARIYATIPPERLWWDMALLFSINLMGMAACYAIEYYARKNYFFARRLENKKHRLGLLNRFMEKRVAKRTSQFKYAHQRLAKQITERTPIEPGAACEAEAQLNPARHQQAIGPLAGGIAHDFNNILYGVIGFAQMALDDAPSGSVLHDNLQETLKGCYRAKELVGQVVMTLSRQEGTDKKSLHLHSTGFENLLPASSSPGEIEIDTHRHTPCGRERILLVDDEKSLVHMGQQMLTRLGYHVTAFCDPLEALEVFREQPDAFDLLITDLTMPKLKGTRLAQQMLHHKPDLPIILCTGYGDEVAPGQIEALGIRELLFKPILRHQLAAAIRKALNRQTALHAPSCAAPPT